MTRGVPSFLLVTTMAIVDFSSFSLGNANKKY